MHRSGLIDLPVGILLIAVSSSALSGEPSRPPVKLSVGELDRLIAAETEGVAAAGPVTDERFLRRVSLDLIGRPPTPVELARFLKDNSTDKRRRMIDSRLKAKEFGRNWANYWSDVISYHVPPPELTYLKYGPLEDWLAAELNRNAAWDQIVREILTASGKVKDNPPATFVAYHVGNPVRLASETARVFLGKRINCAECHDHPFEDWNREQFHRMAAFFVRAEVKMPWNEGPETVVKDRGKGEYRMPDQDNPLEKGTVMAPAFLSGEAIEGGASDADRRSALADLVVSPGNRWFAEAYVNRIWASLMGRGFHEPVDNISDHEEPLWPEVYRALADHFTASKFDVKDLFRLVMNTRAYLRGLSISPAGQAFVTTGPLRSDVVFDSLVAATGLPNITPPAVKPTKLMRFPPPPQSTRDIVNETFGFDPSLPREAVSRTMGQAMLLMNNAQLQKQIDADPESGTRLAKLLAEETDDAAAFDRLFVRVLARKPTEPEVRIALEHVRSVGKRGPAFEDLLWSLVNSAEFLARR